MISKIDIFVSDVANRKGVRSLCRGLIYTMPFILIGSIILAVLEFPILAYENFMIYTFGNGWKEILYLIKKGTLGVMAIITIISVSYFIAQEKDIVKSGEVNAIVIVITAFISFVILNNETSSIIGISELGSNGMFKSIITAIVSCNLFCFFYKFRRNIYPKDVIHYNGSGVTKMAFRSILPIFGNICIFVCFKILQEAILSANIHIVYFEIIKNIIGENIYFRIFLTTLVTHLLWFFGVHGGNIIMDSFIGPETSMYLSGYNTLTKGFFDTYVHLGGSGATLGLLIALLIFGENTEEHRLSRIAIIPGIFNINEVMIFGLPIIFNPYFFIPFILSPVVLSFTACILIHKELIPPVIRTIDWTTPIFLSGYMSTGSVSGMVMQFINLIISILIYMPFIKMQQRYQRKIRVLLFKELSNEIQYVKETKNKIFLNRHDEIGSLSRAIIMEIKQSFRNNSSILNLEYQPKVNYKGEVLGAEALLRCNHPIYGYISPNIIITLCEEAGFMNDLGKWILFQAVKDLKVWNDKGYDKLTLSINISPYQIREDDSLVYSIKNYINKFRVDPTYIELEITENAAIDYSEITKTKFEKIKSLGVNLSIDDFGMGHSSLLYICDFHASVVKIDSSLVRGVVDDIMRKNIIKSILALCNNLNVCVIAEGVENREQVDGLYELGCNYFQGFYFSKSLNSDKFIEYVSDKTNN